MEERHFEKIEHYRIMLMATIKSIRRYIGKKKITQAEKAKAQFRKLWDEYKAL
jgi:hypothetical protein